nr:hypothetical protein [Fodinicola feengrottensis]
MVQRGGSGMPGRIVRLRMTAGIRRTERSARAARPSRRPDQLRATVLGMVGYLLRGERIKLDTVGKVPPAVADPPGDGEQRREVFGLTDQMRGDVANRPADTVGRLLPVVTDSAQYGQDRVAFGFGGVGCLVAIRFLSPSGRVRGHRRQSFSVGV